jgi:hypothetical protein
MSKEVKTEKVRHFCKCGEEIFPGKLLASSRKKHDKSPEHMSDIAKARWKKPNELKRRRERNKEFIKKFVENGGI